MKFARVLFVIAGMWGVLVLTPLYFMFNMIGRQDPPAITHPAFYYGFVGTALAWQIVFFVIAANPVRFRPFIIPSIIEKYSYAIAGLVLYFQARMRASDLVFVAADFCFGGLFLIAFFVTPRAAKLPSGRQGQEVVARRI
ncbi:MAG TPA: hypothetical protein VFA90_16175 [Terriglobales bacterium]|nr:hypothetical protein [Terriglobales bacterium]